MPVRSAACVFVSEHVVPSQGPHDAEAAVAERSVAQLTMTDRKSVV